jgi:hypothetical protein
VKEADCAFKRGVRKERQWRKYNRNNDEVDPRGDVKIVDSHGAVKGSGRDASYPGRQSLEEEAQREYKKAMELYDKALAVNSHVEVRLTRAACILHLKDVPGAAKAYQLAAPDCKCLDACVCSMSMHCFWR